MNPYAFFFLLAAFAFCILCVALGYAILQYFQWEFSAPTWLRRTLGGAWYCRGGRWTREPPMARNDPVEASEFWPEPVGRP